jgi:hypothetical protein
VLKPCCPAIFSSEPKGVNIGLANILPVGKLNTQLKSGLHFRHKFTLINAQQLVQCNHGGNGRFTHTYGADFIGLHQRDVQILAN